MSTRPEIRANTIDSFDFLVIVINVVKPEFRVTCQAVPQARLKAVVTTDQNSHVALTWSTHIWHLQLRPLRETTCCGYMDVLCCSPSFLEHEINLVVACILFCLLCKNALTQFWWVSWSITWFSDQTSKHIFRILDTLIMAQCHMSGQDWNISTSTR